MKSHTISKETKIYYFKSHYILINFIMQNSDKKHKHFIYILSIFRFVCSAPDSAFRGFGFNLLAGLSAQAFPAGLWIILPELTSQEGNAYAFSRSRRLPLHNYQNKCFRFFKKKWLMIPVFKILYWLESAGAYKDFNNLRKCSIQKSLILKRPTR